MRTKYKELVVMALNYLKFRYFADAQETLTGYKNFLILFDMFNKFDLQSAVRESFENILQAVNFEVELIVQMFLNLIRLGVTSSNCLIILNISEKYRENEAYEPLFEIFMRVVCEYAAQKVHVERGSEDVLNILQFFFYGFSGVYDITQDTLMKFTRSLKFMAVKNNKKTKNLEGFIDFLEVIVNNYEQSAVGNTNAFMNLKEVMQAVKQEFNINRDSRSLRDLYSRAKSKVWSVPPDSIRDPSRQSSIAMLMNRYKIDSKYKGLTNLGNSNQKLAYKF